MHYFDGTSRVHSSEAYILYSYFPFISIKSGEEPIDVTVTLSSNEVQGKPNDQDMGFIVKKNAVNPDQVERARIVLAPTT